MRVTAVVPARNEADRVGETVTALKSFCTAVVVVDDGSSDHTSEVARDAGAEVVRADRNIGKGRALELGLDRVGGEGVLLFADADLAGTAGHLESLLAPLVEGTADLCVATFPPLGGGFGTVKRFARWAIRRLGGIDVTEPLSGQRAIMARDLARLRPLARGFGVETAMTIDAARQGLGVCEVALPLDHRPTGRDLKGFVHRGRQGIDIAWAVLLRVVGKR